VARQALAESIHGRVVRRCSVGDFDCDFDFDFDFRWHRRSSLSSWWWLLLARFPKPLEKANVRRDEWTTVIWAGDERSCKES